MRQRQKQKERGGDGLERYPEISTKTGRQVPQAPPARSGAMYPKEVGKGPRGLKNKIEDETIGP
jgi:hypothetical protein